MPALGQLRFPLAILASLSVLAPSTAIAVTFYSITPLFPLGGKNSTAAGINNRGQVVGGADLPPIETFETTGDTRAVVYNQGVPTNLGVLPGDNTSYANAINDRGQIVGGSGVVTSGIPEPPARAFLFSQGQMRDLGHLPGQDFSVALDINNRGQIVGSSGSRAFLYDQGGMQDLGTLGGNTSSANAINNRGEVVGGSRTAEGESRAFLYSQGRMTDIGIEGTSSSALDINDRGEIVGAFTVPNIDSWAMEAFRYRDGQFSSLGTLPGDNISSANSINNRGQVVGFSYSSTEYRERAFIYDDREGMIDLNTRLVDDLGWHLLRAGGINDRGQIVGAGYYGGSPLLGFLATPVGNNWASVPEPGLLLGLAGIGLGGVGAWFKRR